MAEKGMMSAGLVQLDTEVDLHLCFLAVLGLLIDHRIHYRLDCHVMIDVKHHPVVCLLTMVESPHIPR